MLNYDSLKSVKDHAKSLHEELHLNERTVDGQSQKRSVHESPRVSVRWLAFALAR